MIPRHVHLHGVLPRRRVIAARTFERPLASVRHVVPLHPRYATGRVTADSAKRQDHPLADKLALEDPWYSRGATGH
jgi:hypothetical protein